MDKDIKKGLVVTTTKEIGALIRDSRKEQEISQMMAAGIFGSGNRFISDAENGKKTIQAQKLLDLLHIVGLEVIIRKKQSDE